MFLLPKGNPLFENLAATRLKLPDIIQKLKAGKFTGYATFAFQASTVILVFESGQLVSALLENKNGDRQNGFEAMSGLADLMTTSSSGILNVFRLSKDLTMCIHALLQGETLYKAQELKLIDIKVLLEKIKNDQLNGCLRIYTEDRSAMIFYKQGTPLGFFHDGSSDIETSAEESQKVAGLPGAKLDLYSTTSTDELMNTDLLDVVNVDKIWEASVARQQSEREKLSRVSEEQKQQALASRLDKLEDALRAIVNELVGKMGGNIVEKEISALGGVKTLQEPENQEKLITGIERSAKLLTSATNVKLLVERLRGEFATLFPEE